MTMGASFLAAAPVLVPLVTAALTAALAAQPRLQRAASIGGALALLACAALLLHGAAQGEVLEARFGGWAAPFAIAFRIDAMSALMILAAALLALVALAWPEADEGRGARFRPALLHGLLAGAGGAYATSDLFNLYVWFEVMLVAALGLIARGGRARHLDAAFKYLVLNLFGTVLLLVAVAGLYGLTGALNYAALAEALAGRGHDPLALTLIALLVAALLVKAGAFPFFFWLPAAYPVLPVSLLALFTALMTKAGAYTLLRVFDEVFPAALQTFAVPLGWLASATMLVGVLGAVHHYDVRRILAFHSVSQMGYILLAVALGGAAGMTAALFFVIHHILVKSNLYLIGGLIARSGGFDLRRCGGLYRSQPAAALLFGVTAAALVGIPPLSGFWAKLLVLREGVAQSAYVWSAVALATGGLTLLSMSKIWIEAFWKPHPDPSPRAGTPLPRAAWMASGTLVLLALALGLAPTPLIELLHEGLRGGAP